MPCTAAASSWTVVMMGMSYDGVSSKDTGFGAANYVTPSLDSIAEVVQLV